MAKFELEYIFIEGTVACLESFESVFKIFSTVFFVTYTLPQLSFNSNLLVKCLQLNS